MEEHYRIKGKYEYGMYMIEKEEAMKKKEQIKNKQKQ